MEQRTKWGQACPHSVLKGKVPLRERLGVMWKREWMEKVKGNESERTLKVKEGREHRREKGKASKQMDISYLPKSCGDILHLCKLRHTHKNNCSIRKS